MNRRVKTIKLFALTGVLSTLALLTLDLRPVSSDFERRSLTPVQSFARVSQPGDMDEGNFKKLDSFLSKYYDPANGLGAPGVDAIGQPLRNHPHGLALTLDGRKLYVTFEGNDSEPRNIVAVIDTATNTKQKEIVVGLRPLGIEIDPSGRWAVVANQYSNWLSIIDTTTDEVAREVQTFFYAQDIVFNTRGDRMFVSNRALDNVHVYSFDASSGQATLLREIPVHISNQPFNLGDDPRDGPYGTGGTRQNLANLGLPPDVVDPEFTRLLTNCNPRDMAIVGRYLYVATVNGLGVAIIDIEQGRQVDSIDLNSPAWGISAAGPLVFIGTGGRFAQVVTTERSLDEKNKRDPSQNEIAVVDVRRDPFNLIMRYTSLPNPPNGPPGGPPLTLEQARALLVPATGEAPYLSAFGDASVPNTDSNRDNLPTLVDGAIPNQMTTFGNLLFVTMEASDQLEVYRINPDASDARNILTRLPASSAFTNSGQLAFPSAINRQANYDNGFTDRRPIDTANFITGDANPEFFNGRRPQEVVVSPDGRRAYVANMLGESVAVFDVMTDGLRYVTHIDLTLPDYPRFPATLAEMGEDFFTSSRIVLDRNFTCLTCHPGIGTDSKAWKAGSAPGNTMRDVLSTRNQRDAFPFYNSGGRVHSETFRAGLRDFSPDSLFGGDLDTSTLDTDGDGVLEVLDRGYARAFLYRNNFMTLERCGVGSDYVNAALGAFLEVEPRLLANPFKEPDGSYASRVVIGYDAEGRPIIGDAQAGEAIFRARDCAVCHTPPTFTNNGLMTLDALDPLLALWDMDGDGIPDGVVPSLEIDIDFIYTSTFDDNESLLYSVPIERGATNGGDSDLRLFVADIDRVDPRSPLSGRAFVNNTADARNVRVKPLRGIWDTAPYLHHGRAATLLDVLTTFATEQHRMMGLTPTEAIHLAAFLQSIE